MYVKLFSKILDSSIWLESDSTVRVWITLLASMDSEGMCHFASIENLSRRARVYPYLAKKAVAILEAPDPRSSGDGHEGRRIEKVQGGWLVLNAKKYREIRSSGDLRKPSKPRQLPATPDDSPQLPATTDLSTNGINKSLPEVEVEADKEEEQKPPVRFKVETPAGDEDFERLCEAHPKPERSYITENRYFEAVTWVAARKTISHKEAAVYIVERAEAYKRLCGYPTGLTKWLEAKIFEWTDAVMAGPVPIRSPKGVNLDELYGG